MSYYTDRYDEAWQSYLDAERLINQLDNPKERLIRSSMNTLNLLIVSTHLGKTDKTEEYEKRLYEIKQEALKQEKTLTPDEQKEIFSPICLILYDKYLDADNAETGKEKEADQLLQELIDMIEKHYALSDKDDGFKKMYLFVKRAQILENQNFQLAEEYYQKSLKEMLINHLDNDPSINYITCAIYNAYARLLQKNISHLEAIIYYNRALEIFESSKYTGHTFSEDESILIDRIGKALTSIYEENKRPIEAERLERRLTNLKNAN